MPSCIAANAASLWLKTPKQGLEGASEQDWVQGLLSALEKALGKLDRPQPPRGMQRALRHRPQGTNGHAEAG